MPNATCYLEYEFIIHMVLCNVHWTVVFIVIIQSVFKDRF